MYYGVAFRRRNPLVIQEGAMLNGSVEMASSSAKPTSLLATPLAKAAGGL